MNSNKKYIACLDVGTTTVRCHIINSKAKAVGQSCSMIKLLFPEPGHVEIDPNELWSTILSNISLAIIDANLTANSIQCLAISTQRSTFTTWNKTTGNAFHNFITWKDIRANHLCKTLNSSVKMAAVRWLAYCVYLVTRSDRFLTGSRLTLAPSHVTGRLLWAVNNVPELRHAIAQDNALFGTIDTWLVYKLTNRRLHITDVTNASATGFFDPYVLEWGSWSKTILDIPHGIFLPTVVANDHDFGCVDRRLFGASMPIKCVMADQSCSLLASSCTSINDVKITLGTGAFLNVNTDKVLHASTSGLYPLIGWHIKGKILYMAEGSCYDCGSLIQWMLQIGLISNPFESSKIAQSVSSSNGVYFVPAFSGLGPPINDFNAASGFFGISPTTSKNHLVRAVLESIAYRIALCFDVLKEERRRNYNRIRIDGGVSNNGFVCQLLSDLINADIERTQSSELSALGAGFLAGLITGLWTDFNEMEIINPKKEVFQPSTDADYKNKCRENLHNWMKVTKRFNQWYT